MSPRRTFSGRATAMMLAALTLCTLLSWAGPATAVPPYTTEERAFAIAGPSLVFVEMRSKGLLRRKDNGEALHTVPFVVSYRCTGFVVSGAGHFITNTHCAQPDAVSLRNGAISLFVADRIKVGVIQVAQRDAYTKDLQGIAEFTGEAPGSKPDTKVYGQMFQGQVGLTTEPAMQAEVVSSQPGADGDVTLFKMPINGLPMAELSAEQLNTSAPVVLAAFGVDSGSSLYTARLKPSKITGRAGTETPATYNLESDLGGASHGGLVLDTSGRVVGMINTDFAHKDKLNRLVTSLEYIRSALTAANVGTGLSETDSNYREGLNAYFGGRYSEAIRRFDSVLAVMPEHAVASSYRKQAVDRLAIEGDASGLALPTWMLVALIALGIVLLVIIAIVIGLIRRRPVRVDWQSSPVSALPVSAYPISPMLTSGGGVQYDYLPAMLSEHELPQPNFDGHDQSGEPVGYPDADGKTGSPGRQGKEDNPWAPSS